MIRKLWLTGGWLLIAAIVLLSIVSLIQPPDIPEGDKLQHLLAYGVLMAWWCQIQLQASQRRKLAVYFVLLGVVMEFVQGLTPDRDPEVLDAVADAIGVSIGWALAPPRVMNLYRRMSEAFPRLAA